MSDKKEVSYLDCVNHITKRLLQAKGILSIAGKANIDEFPEDESFNNFCWGIEELLEEVEDYLELMRDEERVRKYVGQ